MNGDTDIRPRDVIYSPLFQQASPQRRVEIIEKIAASKHSKDPFFTSFASRSPEDKLAIVGRMSSDKIKALSSTITDAANQRTIGPEPKVNIPFGPSVNIPVTQSTFREAAGVLPYAGGAVGGGLASPGLITGAGGAMLGGAAGKSLEDILLHIAGLTPVPPEGAAESPTGQEIQRIAGAAGEQGLLEAGGRVIGKVGRALSPAVKASAEKSEELVLGPTKEKLKAAAAEEVAPGMLERKIVGTSRRQLLELARTKAKEFSKLVGEQARAADASGKPVDVEALLNKLETVKENFMVRDASGQAMTGSTPALNQINGMQSVLKKYGKTILPTDLINLRRFWDDEVAGSQLGFLLDTEGRTVGSSAMVTKAERAATNAIRDTLNKKFPDLEAVNQQYHFWREMQTVLTATQQRTGSQTNIVGKVLHYGGPAFVGGVAGEAVGGKQGAETGFLAGAGLGLLMSSTAWRTVSAIQKDRIARFLAKGQLEQANNLARAILAATNDEGEKK